MPMDTIKRAIARASGEGSDRQIEEIRYEGYGPSGLAVVVDAATDNRNRTAAELRFLFSRHGGALGESGSVAWMFDPRGIVDVDPQGRTEEQLTEEALVDGVVDVRLGSGGYGEPAEVITEPGELADVREALSAKGLRVTGFVLGVEPKSRVVLEGSELAAALDFLEALDEREDVQRVFSNLDVDDAQIEALA
jgi:YebC/PmpR family DNA-binding regulatory protein